MTVWGDYYQFHRQFDSAEVYLNRAMDYAERSGSMDAKRWVLSAFHAMYFNAGEYEKSGDYLRQFMQSYLPDVSDSLLMYYYHDMRRMRCRGSDEATKAASCKAANK